MAFLLILGILRIRASNRRAEADQEAEAEMAWDDTALNITVNPMQESSSSSKDCPTSVECIQQAVPAPQPAMPSAAPVSRYLPHVPSTLATLRENPLGDQHDDDDEDEEDFDDDSLSEGEEDDVDSDDLDDLYDEDDDDDDDEDEAGGHHGQVLVKSTPSKSLTASLTGARSKHMRGGHGGAGGHGGGGGKRGGGWQNSI